MVFDYSNAGDDVGVETWSVNVQQSDKNVTLERVVSDGNFTDGKWCLRWHIRAHAIIGALRHSLACAAPGSGPSGHQTTLEAPA